MFTGIVQGTGIVVAIEEKETIHTLTIEIPNTDNLAIGASVAVDGACLTDRSPLRAAGPRRPDG